MSDYRGINMNFQQPSINKGAIRPVNYDPNGSFVQGLSGQSIASGGAELLNFINYQQALRAQNEAYGDIEPAQVNYETEGMAPQLATSGINSQMESLYDQRYYDDGNAFKSGLQGAKTGAAIGSVASPVGSLIGAAVGFVGGLTLGGRKERKRAEAAQDAYAKLEKERVAGLNKYNQSSQNYYSSDLSQDYMRTMQQQRQARAANAFGFPGQNYSLI